MQTFDHVSPDIEVGNEMLQKELEGFKTAVRKGQAIAKAMKNHTKKVHIHCIPFS